MVDAVDIKRALARHPVFDGRRPDTPDEQLAPIFATLAPFNSGNVYAGSFSGESAWERHPMGDELVQVLDGATRLTILTESGEAVLEMQKGMLTVVPRNHWHKFHAPGGVTLLTTTPLPTDHSIEDPRNRT